MPRFEMPHFQFPNGNKEAVGSGHNVFDQLVGFFFYSLRTYLLTLQ